MRIVCVLVCATALGQDYGLRPGGIEVGFAGGGISQTSSAPDTGYKPTYALTLGAGATERLGVAFRFTSAAYNNTVTFNARPFAFESTLGTSMGEARYELRRTRTAPFVVGSIGGLQVRNITTTATDQRFITTITDDLNLRDGWQLAYGAGAGININATKKFGIELSFRALRGQHTNWWYQPSAGLYYRFQ